MPELEFDTHLAFIEDRRKAAEGVLWPLPGATIAAQAFLLNAGLDQDAAPATRYLVAGLGIAVVVITASVVAYQMVRALVYSRWIEQSLGDQTADEHRLARDLVQERYGLTRWQDWLLRRFPPPFLFLGLALLGFVGADIYVIFK